MTESPKNFADRPSEAKIDPAVVNSGDEQSGDVLSMMLRSVRLHGDEVFCCAPASPFAISFDQSGGSLHIVNEGAFELQLEGQSETYRCKRGDVVMVGLPHTIRHGRRVKAHALAQSDQRFAVVTHAEGIRWLTGTFSRDDSRKEYFLHSLPPVVQLHGAGDQSLLWLDVSTQMLMKEMTEPTQGSREMISRILDLLFIQVLRAWATGPDATPGWLTGALDPAVGDAIAAIHADPAHPWTIDRLAAKSHLSRSAFADRFAKRVGQPPATYVAQVRLDGAAELLQDTTRSVGAIASEVGYDSEAAFSRAFAKRYGIPPARWRRERSQRWR